MPKEGNESPRLWKMTSKPKRRRNERTRGVKKVGVDPLNFEWSHADII